jgi:hypothetical protein
MARKKNPGSARTRRVLGKRKPALSGSTCHQKKRPDIDVILDACRVAQEVAALCEAQDAAKVESAALALGIFEPNENGRWVHQCPDCRQSVTLGITVNGHVRASSSGQKTCHKVPRINQWLCDNGFQS